MPAQWIVDTGFLIALLNRSEQYHPWVKAQLSQIYAPLLTCEAVITETCFLLQNIHQGEDTILKLIHSQKLQIPFQIDQESQIIRELMQQYRSVPTPFPLSNLWFSPHPQPLSQRARGFSSV